MIKEWTFPTEEVADSSVPKSPVALAQVFYDLWDNNGVTEFHFSKPKYKLQNGLLYDPVVIDILKLGVPLTGGNRLLLFKTSALLLKKKLALFFLGPHHVVIYKMNGNYKKVLKTIVKDKPIGKVQKDKLFSRDVYELFADFGIKSGGVGAFFQFIAKLGKKNKGLFDADKIEVDSHSIGSHPQIGVMAVLVDGKVPHCFINKVPFWTLREQNEEDEENKTDEAAQKIPPVQINPVKSLPSPKPIVLDKKEKLKEHDLNLPESEYGKAGKLKHAVVNESAKAVLNHFHILKKEDAYELVNESIADWAGDSTEGGSILLHAVAAKLFNIKKCPPYMAKEVNTAVHRIKEGVIDEYVGALEDAGSPDLNKRAWDMYTLFASDIYHRTQKLLKQKGVKQLLLFRGMNDIHFSGLYKYSTILLNPLNSFSTSVDTATNFGDTMLAAYIPRERIFSCAFTGHGCWGEDEYVVIGGKIKCHLLKYTEIENEAENLEDKISDKIEKLESKIEQIEYGKGEYADEEKVLTKEDKQKIKELEGQINRLEELIDRVRNLGSISAEVYGEVIKAKGVKNMIKLAFKEEASVETAEPTEPTEPPADEPTNNDEPSGSSGGGHSNDDDKEEMFTESKGDANWIKSVALDTGTLPLIGTQEFEEYLKKSGKTIEQVLSMTAYKKAHLKYAPVVAWLQRIAYTLDPTKAKVHTQPISGTANKFLCHLEVARAIKERMRKTDKIWFFGDNDGKNPHVFHSLLTDSRNKIVANNYHGVGTSNSQFDPKKGYKMPSGEYIPILDVVKVGLFLKMFCKK